VQGAGEVFQVASVVELLAPGEAVEGGLAEQLDARQHELGEVVRLLGRRDRRHRLHDSNAGPGV
jgi:hypothetical protein